MRLKNGANGEVDRPCLQLCAKYTQTWYVKTLHYYHVGLADKKSTRSELNLQPVYQTSISNVTEVPEKGIFWSVTEYNKMYPADAIWLHK